MAGKRDVVAPDGTAWHVRRRWVPRLGAETIPGRFVARVRKTMRRAGDIGDVGDPGCALDIGEGIVVGVIVIVGLLLLIFILIPVLVAIVDLAILILLFFLGLLARVVLRRPWIVHAWTSEDRIHDWKVVGWNASGAFVDDLAARIEAGLPLPPGGS